MFLTQALDAGPTCSTPATRSAAGSARFTAEGVGRSVLAQPVAAVLFCVALAHDQRARQRTAIDGAPRRRWVSTHATTTLTAGTPPVRAAGLNDRLEQRRFVLTTRTPASGHGRTSWLAVVWPQLLRKS
ncbi:MAG TPA: hypothetical protein VGH89_35830 [Pseudonocardia sp.]